MTVSDEYKCCTNATYKLTNVVVESINKVR